MLKNNNFIYYIECISWNNNPGVLINVNYSKIIYSYNLFCIKVNKETANSLDENWKITDNK